ncbi:MAG: hypothetical protein ACO1QB_04895 [Verrucomicrobiales bacterium]
MKKNRNQIKPTKEQWQKIQGGVLRREAIAQQDATSLILNSQLSPQGKLEAAIMMLRWRAHYSDQAITPKIMAEACIDMIGMAETASTFRDSHPIAGKPNERQVDDVLIKMPQFSF